MGKFGCKGLLLLGSMMLWGGAAQAQYLRSSYFMEGTSARLQFLPLLMCWVQATLLMSWMQVMICSAMTSCLTD